MILTLNEYKKIVRERDEAIRTVGIERQNADRQMNEEKKNAAYQIRQVRDQAVKEIAEMQGALAQAQKDAAYQRHLNGSQNFGSGFSQIPILLNAHSFPSSCCIRSS